ncbi:MAG: radical SAM protein [Hyphomicrobiales bacterium]|nr:radical SAM protein [Hyphomicrobiales bacterium]
MRVTTTGGKARPSGKRRFKLFLIKPSHYDDDGYVIQWMRSAIPSNTLAVLYGLACDCAERKVLGDNVELDIVALDETNTRIRPGRIATALTRNDGFGMVAFVGVQSNQFPHAMDIARKLRAAGVQVAIGGFHVSGCLAMLPKMPDDLQEAQALGISLFAGEAEDRLELVLRDAAAGTLRPLYDFMKDLPSIEAVPTPFLPVERVGRTGGRVTSFDAGRGCPFQCSFCTIINVQGRKSRYRTPDDVEAIVRANLAQGVRAFFITDDNLARNKNWEPIFDRLIEVRADTGVNFSIVIQVDTLCHRIPNFIEKAAKAGVRRVFLGLENINPDNLLAAKKKQNRIAEYRTMLLAWKAVGCFTYAGYILGFPNDTPSSIIHDIEIIQRELPLDLLEFFCLTPLPGSEDHQKLHKAGIPMDPDMNKYDLEHVTTGHPKMSKAEWEGVYRRAWEVYYTPQHMETIMRRAYATGISPGKMMFLLIWFYGCVTIEKIHPLEGGYLRRKVRRDRRPGMPIESPFLFYPKYLAEVIAKHVKIASIVWRMGRTRRAIKRDPKARLYRDLALTPVADADLETLEMFQQNQSSRAAAAKAKLRAAAAA